MLTCPCCGEKYHRASALWHRYESAPGWVPARATSICIFCARNKMKPVKPWDVIGTRFGFPMRCYYNWGRLLATSRGKQTTET